jgi:ABC-type phosphate/phosphonate transport system substrate-binding protein
MSRFLSKFFPLYVVVLLSVTQWIFPTLANAELVLTSPPRENDSAGEKIFGPLAEYLSQLLGKKVVYKYPNNWLEYQRDMRHGAYDIVFDGPHFVSWRIEHLKHDVLVKLPGELEFVIIVNTDDTEIRTVNDLVGRKICGIPPPNLATLIAINQFPNPVRQPIIWGVGGGYMNVFRAFAARQCRAAVFRSTFFDKQLTPQDRTNTHVLYRSKRLPNQAITVSKRVSSEDKRKIVLSLTKDEAGKTATQAIRKRFGDDKAEPFVAATSEEYEGLYSLLEGVIFGW